MGLSLAVLAHIGAQTLACPVQVLNNHWRATAAKPHPDPKMNERHVMNAFGHNAIIVSEALDAVLEAEAASETASPALLSTLCTAATTYFGAFPPAGMEDITWKQDSMSGCQCTCDDLLHCCAGMMPLACAVE